MMLSSQALHALSHNSYAGQQRDASDMQAAVAGCERLISMSNKQQHGLGTHIHYGYA